MESMILVLTPRECADLLNGDLSVLVRKKFPKDYVGWVYTYVAKGKPLFVRKDSKGIVVKLHDSKKNVLEQLCANGKVVARFWCDKVSEIKYHGILGGASLGCHHTYTTFRVDNYPKGQHFSLMELCNASQLSSVELHDYLKGKKGKAIHITKLEIFDKPKEISEFIICRERKHKCRQKFSDYPCKKCVSMNLLTRAPRSYCYIEVDA